MIKRGEWSVLEIPFMTTSESKKSSVRDYILYFVNIYEYNMKHTFFGVRSILMRITIKLYQVYDKKK